MYFDLYKLVHVSSKSFAVNLHKTFETIHSKTPPFHKSVNMWVKSIAVILHKTIENIYSKTPPYQVKFCIIAFLVGF